MSQSIAPKYRDLLESVHSENIPAWRSSNVPQPCSPGLHVAITFNKGKDTSTPQKNVRLVSGTDCAAAQQEMNASVRDYL
jgi:hypothetical protein